jgi:hypothetical protein
VNLRGFEGAKLPRVLWEYDRAAGRAGRGPNTNPT